MNDEPQQPIGAIAWTDLTIENAPEVRDFYQQVVGWTPAPVPMDGYDDYCMTLPDSGDAAVGICHARGPNAALPPQWLIYIRVRDLEASLEQCRAGGGEVLSEPRNVGSGVMAVIRDPAGAACALWQDLPA